MRVGLLGGSFDPIHHGHLLAAVALVEACGLDEVRLVPVQEQPFKTGAHGASAAHRAAMVSAAIAGHPQLRLERAEVERPGPSYTVDTLRCLVEREPRVDWTLLMGVDVAREFEAWREPAAIRSLARVVTFRRAGVATDPPDGMPCVDLSPVGLSATEIRARVMARRSIRYMVPDVVATYIAAHGLYRKTE